MKSTNKLHIKENTELTKQDITGWAVCYRNMNNGYQYLVCFDDVFDARSCENDFYTIEDFDSDDEDFWDIFNRQRLTSSALYDEIDWRHGIEQVNYKGTNYKAYRDGNKLWLLVNRVPFDFYL